MSTDSRKLCDCTEDNTEFMSFDNVCCEGKVVDVYDGDSLTLALPFGGGYYKFKCRLFGIDTAELRTCDREEKKVGLEAKLFLENMVKGVVVWVECGKFDKYGRLLVTSFKSFEEERSVNDMMVDNGYGYMYDGGKRKKFGDW